MLTISLAHFNEIFISALLQWCGAVGADENRGPSFGHELLSELRSAAPRPSIFHGPWTTQP